MVINLNENYNEIGEMVLFAKSINEIPIRLTDERWDHICENHQLDEHKDKVLKTISNPDIVYTAPSHLKPQFIAIKMFPKLEEIELARYLVVHYRE